MYEHTSLTYGTMPAQTSASSSSRHYSSSNGAPTSRSKSRSSRRRRDQSEVSCCLKYVIFGFNVIFWVRIVCIRMIAPFEEQNIYIVCSKNRVRNTQPLVSDVGCRAPGFVGFLGFPSPPVSVSHNMVSKWVLEDKASFNRF